MSTLDRRRAARRVLGCVPAFAPGRAREKIVRRPLQSSRGLHRCARLVHGAVAIVAVAVVVAAAVVAASRVPCFAFFITADISAKPEQAADVLPCVGGVANRRRVDLA